MKNTKKYHYTVRKTIYCEIDIELPYTETGSDEEWDVVDCPDTVIEHAEKHGFNFLCYEIIYRDDNDDTIIIVEGN